MLNTNMCYSVCIVHIKRLRGMDHHLPINLYPVYRIARSRFIIQIVVQDLTQAGDISDFVRIQDIPC